MIINKDNLTEFRKEFIDALTELSKKHNIKITLGNISYNESGFHSKIDVTNLDEASLQKEVDRKNRYLASSNANFKIGYIFKNGVSQYKVVDINPKAWKKPIIIQDIATNQRYSCSIEFVDREYYKRLYEQVTKDNENVTVEKVECVNPNYNKGLHDEAMRFVPEQYKSIVSWDYNKNYLICNDKSVAEIILSNGISSEMDLGIHIIVNGEDIGWF